MNSFRGIFRKIKTIWLKPAKGESLGAFNRQDLLYYWRRKILNIILTGTFFLVFIATMAGVNNQLRDGRTYFAALYILSCLAIAVVTFVRTLPYTLRVSVLLIVNFLVAASELKSSGFAGDGNIFLAATVVLSVIFLQRRISYIVFASSIVTMLLFAYLVVNRWILLPPFLGEVCYRWRNWQSAITAFIFETGTMLLAIAYVTYKMETSLQMRGRSIAKLHKEITVRKKTEDNLLIFKKILTGSPYPIAFVDDHLQIRSNEWLNDAFHREFSQSQNFEFPGYILDFFDDPMFRQILAEKVTILDDLNPVEFDYRSRKDNGDEIYYEIQFIPVWDVPMEHIRFLFIARDITGKIQEEERIAEAQDDTLRKISMVLHDSLAHFLLNIAIQCRMLARRLARTNPGDGAELHILEEQVNQGIALTRSISRGLYPAESEEQNLLELLLQKKKFLEDSFHMKCVLSIEPLLHIRDRRSAIHLNYIIQEAILNVVNHAAASSVEITLTGGDDHYELVIADNGMSVSNPQEGAGLKIMKFRASRIGGSLFIMENPTGGTRIVCQLPADFFIIPGA